MELFKKTCKNHKCGKEFMGKRTQQYCNPACRVPTYKPVKRNNRKRVSTLDEVAKQAKELGISYGKYVAMQYKNKE